MVAALIAAPAAWALKYAEPAHDLKPDPDIPLWKPAPLTRLPPEHTIYRSFFLLDRPYGRITRNAFLEGVDFDERSPILYSRNDLFGALGRDSLGQWLLPVVPGGSVQREIRGVLFDGGPVDYAVERNGTRLGVQFAEIEAMVLSHGH